MIKAFRAAMAAAITAAAVIGVGSANAQGTNTYATGFQIVNLSSTEANATITFYAEGGTTAATFNTTIPANGNRTFSNLATDIADLPDGFAGGAVVSSDQEVAALVNVIRDGDFGVGASYSGVSEGATTVTLPLLFRDFFGFNTAYNVQNVSTSVANVTINYSNGATESAAIQPGASARFDQTNNADIPTDFSGSATITSDQPVAAAVVQNGSTVLSYNGFTSTSTAPVLPLINANNFEFFTGISMQNSGTESTDVTVSYTPSTDGTACTETQTIPSGETRFFALYSIAEGTGDSPTPITSDCARGETLVGSAQVTANSASQPLTAIVNQQNNVTAKGGSYSGFDASEATDTIIFAIIQDRFFNYFTGYSIVNVGDVATAIECVYSDTDVTQGVESLAPGETFTINQQNVIADAYNGSGVCTASASGAQIIGILNQVNAGAPGDAFFVSNGINN